MVLVYTLPDTYVNSLPSGHIMPDNPSLVTRIWGSTGSMPNPLTGEQVFEDKQVGLVKEIKRLGLHKSLFEGSVDDETIRKLLKDNISPAILGTAGGNTTAIEILAEDSPAIVVDMGTGLKNLGNELARRYSEYNNFNPLNSDPEYNDQIYILSTHGHLDHIIGLPIFVPAYMETKIHIYATRAKSGRSLQEQLNQQQEYSSFPVGLDDFASTITIDDKLPRLATGHKIPAGKTTITYTQIPHPGDSTAYCAQVNGKKIVIATDCEHRDIVHPGLVNLAENAEAFYYDAHFTDQEYRGEVGFHRITWGHSTPTWAVRHGVDAGVGIVLLGHKSPDRTDTQLYEIEKRAKEFAKQYLEEKGKTTQKLEVMAAREGMVLAF